MLTAEEETRRKRAKVKDIKSEIEGMRVETLELGRKNAADHARIVEGSAEVGSLYKSIKEMELELARLKGTHPPEKVSWRWMLGCADNSA